MARCIRLPPVIGRSGLEICWRCHVEVLLDCDDLLHELGQTIGHLMFDRPVGKLRCFINEVSEVLL